jgi:hypothetical protein
LHWAEAAISDVDIQHLQDADWQSAAFRKDPPALTADNAVMLLFDEADVPMLADLAFDEEFEFDLLARDVLSARPRSSVGDDLDLLGIVFDDLTALPDPEIALS